MTTLIWAPYSTADRESGLVTALGSFLAKHGEDITQIRCTGSLLACGRDKVGKRKFSQCFECIAESKAFANWAGIKSKDLSQFLAADDWSKARTWIYSVSAGDLPRIEFKGTPVSELVGQIDPGSEARYRELLVAAVLCSVAAEKLAKEMTITRAFIANSNDPLSRAMSTRLTALNIESIIFENSAEDGPTLIRSSKFSRPYATPLFLDDLSKLRSDIRSWPPEVASEVHKIIQFLNSGGGIEVTTGDFVS